MEIQVEKLPKALKQRGLEERLSEICEKNDVAFLAVFGSFVREANKKTKAMLTLRLNMKRTKEKRF